MIYDSVKYLERYIKLLPPLAPVLPRLYEILHDPKLPVGKIVLSGDVYVTLQEYQTKPIAEGRLEGHREYADIQIVLRGSELFFTAAADGLAVSEEYDAQKDILFFEGDTTGKTRLIPGMFVIAFPNDAHMPAIAETAPDLCRKAVIKVKYK